MDDSPTTRPGLLARLRSPRDERAWEEFAAIYGPPIVRLARRRGLQPADAADLAQEVFGAVAAAIDGYDLDPARGSFRGRLFQTKANDTGGRWEATAAGVRATLPKGPANNQPTQLVGQFRLEGDFEIVADYQVESLPKATRDRSAKDSIAPSNNAEIGMSGPGWIVTCYRANTEAADDQMGFHAKPPTGDTKAFSFACTRPKETRGRLGFRRVGDMLTILHDQSDGFLMESDSIRFGTDPVPEPSFRLIKLNSRDPLAVTYARLEVRAGRVVRKETIDARTWSALATISGGEVIGADDS